MLIETIIKMGKSRAHISSIGQENENLQFHLLQLGLVIFASMNWYAISKQ